MSCLCQMWRLEEDVLDTKVYLRNMYMHMSMYVYNMFIQLIQCTVIEILQNRTLVIY